MPRRSLLRIAQFTPLAFFVLAACGEGSTPSGTAPESRELLRQVQQIAPQEKLVPPSDFDFVTQLEPGVSVEQFATIHGLTVVRAAGNLALFTGPIELEELSNLPGIQAASTNAKVNLAESLDLVFGFHEGEWTEGDVEGQDAFAMMSLVTAHRYSTGSGVRVAVLDTGADLEHVHLIPILDPLDETAGLSSEELADGEDNDGDGLVDEAYGHGTHVSGIIRSVAPEAALRPMRVLNSDGVGSLWDVLEGLLLARAWDADIVNLSLSISPPSRILENMLLELSVEGIAVVGAAGNQGWRNPAYPATSSLVVGVGAMESETLLSEFSGGGSLVEMAAPGVAVLSSYPGNRQIKGTGTSMAAPMVAGTLALALQQGQTDVQEAIEAVCETAAGILPSGGVEHGRVMPVAAILAGGDPRPVQFQAQN